MIVMPPATKSSNSAVLKAKAPHSLSAIAKFLEDLVKKAAVKTVICVHPNQPEMADPDGSI